MFAEDTSSESVYEASSKHLVLSAMQGYNCTIFAYGQTGSGKTHTILSVMKLSGQDIFQHISSTRGDRDFLLRFSAMEIYNEVVRDLLVKDSQALKVLDDPDVGNYAEGLVEEGVRSAEHLEELLRVVDSNRHVSNTLLPAQNTGWRAGGVGVLSRGVCEPGHLVMHHPLVTQP